MRKFFSVVFLRRAASCFLLTAGVVSLSLGVSASFSQKMTPPKYIQKLKSDSVIIDAFNGRVIVSRVFFKAIKRVERLIKLARRDFYKFNLEREAGKKLDLASLLIDALFSIVLDFEKKVVSVKGIDIEEKLKQLEMVINLKLYLTGLNLSATNLQFEIFGI